MWKVGSGAHLLTPFPQDPADPLDLVDPAENSETSIFDDPSHDFGQFACKATPPIALDTGAHPVGHKGTYWAIKGHYTWAHGPRTRAQAQDWRQGLGRWVLARARAHGSMYNVLLWPSMSLYGPLGGHQYQGQLG